MRAIRTYGSVRGALSNGRPYRDNALQGSLAAAEAGAPRAATRRHFWAAGRGDAMVRDR